MAGLYHTISDAPEFLKIEAETISLKMSYGVPVQGQATVSWNVPMPARGCSAGDFGTYCGMVFVVANHPIGPSNYPQDGVFYHDDPTVDPDKHIGDKIGDALVIGSFWEREAKSKMQDQKKTEVSDDTEQEEIPMTTSFIVNDIDIGTAYYVAGFAMDCSLRYHTEGMRAYSDELCHHHRDDSGVQAFQDVALGPGHNGVLPSDGTGLIPGKIYQFDIIYDPDFPTAKKWITHTVKIDGMDAGTYEDLLHEINKSLRQINDPVNSPHPIGHGHYYWDKDTNQLYKFDGSHYNIFHNVLVEDKDPSKIDHGQYWYNPETKELKQLSTSDKWEDRAFISGISYPHEMECDQYWFDGKNTYIWNGRSWVLLDTIVQAECPSEASKPQCGSYWYDTTNNILKEWDHKHGQWKETAAITWANRPDKPNAGDYWFNEKDNHLYRWDTIQSPDGWFDLIAHQEEIGMNGPKPGEIVQEIYVQEKRPITPGKDALWYQKSTETLRMWDSKIGEWPEIPVMVWDDDPTNTDSNDLWWNSVNNKLYHWDVVNNKWKEVHELIEHAKDPLEERDFPLETMWYDTDDHILYRWNGDKWVEVNAIISKTDPTDPSYGHVYHNIDKNKWFVHSGDEWIEFKPIESKLDPSIIPNGYFWMDSRNYDLYVRNGMDWVSVSYGTERKKHRPNTEWFNRQDGKLYKWDALRSEWKEGEGPVKAIFAEYMEDGCKKGGGIQFQTERKGTGNIVFIPAKKGCSSAAPGCCTTGFADFDATAVAPDGPWCSYSTNEGARCGYPVRDIDDRDFLWTNLDPCALILGPREGVDAPHNAPSYDILGVGTDGTPDERRELIDSIRRQLGYPTITVELTHYQIDTAVQGALESYRKRTSASLKRGYYFLDIKPRQQRYMLTNRRIGYDKIVQVMDTHRFKSAFLTTAHGAGAYGQTVLQHLYNMGTYDLLSYDLISQYINQLEISFATRLAFNFNEDSRALDFYDSFVYNERILLDVMVERTEQEIMKDRFAKSWIERYALAESMITLGQIRGKFSTLPGAGGGIQLNADQLFSLADSYREELMVQIDDFVIEKPEEIGMGASFVFG